MRGKPIEKREIEKIIKMRKTGHSLPEICKLLGRGGSTVHKYAKNVVVLPMYRDSLKSKQGGSKKRAITQWGNAVLEASELLKKIEKREKLFILASLYWGEGTKKNGLDIINGDSSMIRVFISCLREIGVSNSDLRISLRLYEDISVVEAKKYWADVCGVGGENIASVNILTGNKKGKLQYGMCRVRVTKSSKCFKLIMSMIEFIKLGII